MYALGTNTYIGLVASDRRSLHRLEVGEMKILKLVALAAVVGMPNVSLAHPTASLHQLGQPPVTSQSMQARPQGALPSAVNAPAAKR